MLKNTTDKNSANEGSGQSFTSDFTNVLMHELLQVLKISSFVYAMFHSNHLKRCTGNDAPKDQICFAFIVSTSIDGG